MNKRIRELAEQAGISLSQKDFSYYWVESAEDIEKFAQLNISDCIQTLINNGYDDAAKCLQDIHFGIDYPV